MNNYRQHKLFLVMLFFLSLFALMGCSSSPEPTPAPAITDAVILQGQAVFTAKCAICHANVPDNVVRGPSLHGIAQRAETRVAGQDARTYIYASIMLPSEYLVEGFDDLMPKSLAKELTGEELDAVVDYLFTLQ